MANLMVGSLTSLTTFFQFVRCAVDLARADLDDRRLSNPDSFEYLHTLTVQAGSESVDVLPVFQSLLPLNEVIQLPNFFDALDIVLLSVDASTGEALRDDNGDLISTLRRSWQTTSRP
jgi:hypothetical protein